MTTLPCCRRCNAPVSPHEGSIEWCPACEVHWPLAQGDGSAVGVPGVRGGFVREWTRTAWERRSRWGKRARRSALWLAFALASLAVIADGLGCAPWQARPRRLPAHVRALEADLGFLLPVEGRVRERFPGVRRVATATGTDALTIEIDDREASLQHWGSLPALRLAYLKTLVLEYALEDAPPTRVVLRFVHPPQGTLEWRASAPREIRARKDADDWVRLPGRAWFTAADGVVMEAKDSAAAGAHPGAARPRGGGS